MAAQKEQNYASKAKLSTAMISPQRCRIVANMVRGQKLEAANRILMLEKQKSAAILLKLIRSAAFNAQEKGTVDLDRLYVSELQVNEGPTVRRHMPRAQGRADLRVKRTSHIEVKLAERGAAKKVKKVTSTAKSAAAKTSKKTTKKSAKKTATKKKA